MKKIFLLFGFSIGIFFTLSGQMAGGGNTGGWGVVEIPGSLMVPKGNYNCSVVYSIWQGNYDIDCANYFQMTFIDQKGQTLKTLHKDMNLCCRDGVLEFIFGSDKKINSIYLKGRRGWNSTFNACNKNPNSYGEAENTISFPAYTSSYYNTARMTNIAPQWDGNISFQIRPSNFEIYSPTGVRVDKYMDFVCDDTITLYGTRGYPESDYQWVLLTNNISKILENGKSSVKLTNNSFGGRFSLLKLLGKTAVLQLKHRGANDSIYDQVIVNIKAKSPQLISKPVVIQPKCYNEKGSIQFEFDRMLYDINEYLSVSCKGESLYVQPELEQKTTTLKIEELSAGVYTINYLSEYKNFPLAEGNLTPFTFIINPPPARPTISKIDTVAARCNVAALGQVNISIQNAISPFKLFLGSIVYEYSYPRSPLKIETIPGHYNIHIEDANKCISEIKTAIVRKDSIKVTAITTTVTNLTNPNGEIQIKAEGGGGSSYSYSWQENNSTTSKLTGLSAGTYTTTVKNDKNCQATKSFEVKSLLPLKINVNISYSGPCNSSNIVKLSATRGGGSYTYFYRTLNDYSWNEVSTIYLYNLETGSYYFKVRDNFGNENISDVKDIKALPPISYNLEVVSPLCPSRASGRIVIKNISGGIGGKYTHALIDSKGKLVRPYTSSAYISLSQGWYILEIMDARQCLQVDTIRITDPTPVQVTATTTDPSSPDASDGSITLRASGGTPPYEYSFLDTPYQAINTLTDRPSDVTYFTYAVRDNNSCTYKGSARILYPLTTSISETKKITCMGDANASLTANAVGGVPPYQYQWFDEFNSLIDKTSSLRNLASGKYKLIVKDKSLIGKTTYYTIIAPDSIKVDYSIQLPSNDSAEDGKITLDVQGGYGSYSYIWEQGVSIQNTAINLPAKAQPYSVLIQDKEGCSKTIFPRIIHPLKVSFIVDSIRCEGDMGSIEAVPLGGVGNYEYTWFSNSGDTLSQNRFLKDVPKGIYHLKLRSADAIKNEIYRFDTLINVSVSLSDPKNLQISFTEKIPSKPDTNDGKLSIFIEGGAPPYTCFWAHESSDKDSIVNLYARDTAYSVWVTDSKGCCKKASSRLLYPLTVQFKITDSVSCNGEADGALEAFAFGGVGKKYTYKWVQLVNNQEFIVGNNPSITNLFAGIYRIIIQDIEKNEVSVTLILQQPDPLSIVTSFKNPSCFEWANGHIQLDSVKGGNPPYVFFFQDEKQDTIQIPNLSAGSYFLTIHDRLGCKIEKVEILENPLPLSIMGNSKIPSKHDTNDGWIQVEVLNGHPPYFYLWKNQGNLNQSLLKDIPASDSAYAVFVTDGRGCQVSYIERLIYPLGVTISILDSITCSYSQNGVLSAFAFGGVGKKYRYIWEKWQNDLFLPLSQNTLHKKDQLSKGIYRIRVQDVENNSAQDTFVFQAPDTLQIRFNKKDLSCFKSQDGHLEILLQGGTPPYHGKYPISDSLFLLKNLTADLYSFEAFDQKFCIARDSISVNQPDSLYIQLQTRPPSSLDASDGSICTQISGGSMPYDYIWHPSMTKNLFLEEQVASDTFHSFCVRDVNGCVATDSTRITYPLFGEIKIANSISCAGFSDGSLSVQAFGGVGKKYRFEWYTINDTINSIGQDTSLSQILTGMYRVKIFDIENNSVNTNWFYLSEPSPLGVNLEWLLPSDYGLSDGCIALIPTGGTQPYQYCWQDGFDSTYSSLSNLEARDRPYNVTVVDRNQCKIDLQPRLIMPLKPHIFVLDSISCSAQKDGSLYASAQGGVGKSYRFEWYKQEASQVNKIEEGDTLLNIGQGFYYIKVIDQENIEFLSEAFAFYDPSSLTLTFTKTDILCKFDTNGEVKLESDGGTPPYSYECLSLDNTLCRVSDKASFEHLSEGSYWLSVKDTRGCMQIHKTEITAPSRIKPIVLYKPPLGHNRKDAVAWVEITGGLPPYHYQWNNDALLHFDTVRGIPHGHHSIIVTDANGCMQENSCIIPNPALLQITAKPNKYVSCNGFSNGQISAIAEGGVGNYTYTLFSADGAKSSFLRKGTIPNFADLPKGNYYIGVEDENGIESLSELIVINEPPSLNLFIESVDIDCFADKTGSMKAIVEGGTPPYSYHWSTAHNTEEISKLAAGNYTLRVVDSNQCIIYGQKKINTHPPLYLSDIYVSDPLCMGDSNGFISVFCSGGVAPYNYHWISGQNGEKISDLASGSYELLISDSLGCILDTIFTLKKPDPLYVDIGEDKMLCREQVARFNADINDSSASYRWYKDGLFYANQVNIETTLPGKYEVLVRSKDQCLGSDSVFVFLSDQEIHYAFFVPSMVMRDTIVELVNEFYPSKEQISWILPIQSKVIIVDTSQENAHIIFLENGLYTLGIQASLGLCTESSTRTIEVVDRDLLPHHEVPNIPFVKHFIVYPNPNKGEFNVKIELREEATIKLILIDVVGYEWEKKVLSGQKEYELNISTNLNSGMYYLQLYSDKLVALMKVLITK